MERKQDARFVVWITGLPASGKSTLAAALKAQLEERGVNVAHLESDALREVLTPDPAFDDRERDRFYAQLTFLGELLTRHGVAVILDATANQRAYRDRARARIANFVEVYLECPLATCEARDPKGIYRKARSGELTHVPGLQAVYEPPERPELVLHSGQESPEAQARRILGVLLEKQFIPPHVPGP